MVKKFFQIIILLKDMPRALLKIDDEQIQLKVLQKVCERGLNVRKTEDLVQKALDKYCNPTKTKTYKGQMTRSIKILEFCQYNSSGHRYNEKSGVPARAALDRPWRIFRIYSPDSQKG